MNLLPDQFVPIQGVKVKVAVYDICPLREDYGVSAIVLSVLRDLARGTDILIEFCEEVLQEVSLSEKRIEDALKTTDADLLVFGSYMATRVNLQPMIHLVCTYGRAMEASSGLPEGMDLNQAILEGDAILQLPRHVLVRNLLPVEMAESMSFQNSLADEIFNIARFIQAMKLYKAEKFEESAQAVAGILEGLASPTDWPAYWVPYNYLHMLHGLSYLRLGNNEAAVYTLSDAIARSTPAKMRVQRAAEQILGVLLQPPAEEQAEQGQRTVEGQPAAEAQPEEKKEEGQGAA